MTVRQALLAATGMVLVVIFGAKATGLEFDVTELLGVGGFILTLAGYLRESKVAGTSKAAKPAAPPVQPSNPTFKRNLDAGLFGGLAGGVLAGPIIGGAYHINDSGDTPFPGLIPDIIVASMLAGPLLAISCQLFSDLLLNYQRARGGSALLHNELFGGILGGLATGLVTGALFGWYFGRMPEALISDETLVLGALPGTIAILLLIRVYEERGISLRLLRNFLVALVIGGLLAGIGLAVGEVLGLYETIQGYLMGLIPDTLDLIKGGSLFGLFLGLILGTVIGTSLLLDRVWSRIPAGMQSG